MRYRMLPANMNRTVELLLLGYSSCEPQGGRMRSIKSGPRPEKPKQGPQIEIKALEEIDKLEAIEEGRLLNRFFRLSTRDNYCHIQCDRKRRG